jgi:hypothetical protein
VTNFKKEVGILNFQHSTHNYGAVLQAAALEYQISQLGYEAEHINFISQSKGVIQTLNSIKKSIKELIIKPTTSAKPKVENPEVFETFRQKWVTRTASVYTNINELKALENSYQTVVVGSDQVWRTQYTSKNALVYFLAFVAYKTKRISYAASFGVDFWFDNNKPELTRQIKHELTKFDAISVRESKGVDICKDTFGVAASHVLDPTLLVGRVYFETIIENDATETAEANVVYYKLDIDDAFIADIAKLGQYLNCIAENIYHKEENGLFFYNSVADWLNKIKESKLVVTDSFHCVCFALLFEKPFIYYPNDVRGMSRLDSLLGLVGLKDRICKNAEYFNSSGILDKKIDYNAVNSVLEKLRSDSLQYLSTALSSKKII